jgi:hypothetical protein
VPSDKRPRLGPSAAVVSFAIQDRRATPKSGRQAHDHKRCVLLSGRVGQWGSPYSHHRMTVSARAIRTRTDVRVRSLGADGHPARAARATLPLPPARRRLQSLGRRAVSVSRLEGEERIPRLAIYAPLKRGVVARTLLSPRMVARVLTPRGVRPSPCEPRGPYPDERIIAWEMVDISAARTDARRVAHGRNALPGPSTPLRGSGGDRGSVLTAGFTRVHPPGQPSRATPSIDLSSSADDRRDITSRRGVVTPVGWARR